MIIPSYHVTSPQYFSFSLRQTIFFFFLEEGAVFLYVSRESIFPVSTILYFFIVKLAIEKLKYYHIYVF